MEDEGVLRAKSPTSEFCQKPSQDHAKYFQGMGVWQKSKWKRWTKSHFQLFYVCIYIVDLLLLFN